MASLPNESRESKQARAKQRVRQCTERIVERFRLGDLPEKLAPLFIKRDDGRPCRQRSWRNQLLVALEGFDDARTYLDWQRAGRQVKKGEHAFYILEPCRFKVTETDMETGETKEKMVCRGFKAGARFGYEQTDGEELPYRRVDREIIEGLPLVEVAREWGLKLACFNAQPGGEAGWFKHDGETGKAIAIGVKNWSTWTHELCHAADLRNGKIVKKHGQELSNEIERIDSRACTVADLRELSEKMRFFGFGGNARRAYIIDEIQHLNRGCLRMLLGLLENLPTHVIVIGTTTSVTWADEVDGLFSRWRRFRFRKPSAPAVAEHLERIARETGLPIPEGFRFLSYVQRKCGVELKGNNIRDCIDQLPDTLRRYKGKTATSKAAT